MRKSRIFVKALNFSGHFDLFIILSQIVHKVFCFKSMFFFFFVDLDVDLGGLIYNLQLGLILHSNFFVVICVLELLIML